MTTVYIYEIIVYAITILLVIVANQCRKHPLQRLGGLHQPLPNPAGVILAMIIFCLFSGLRRSDGDTEYYSLAYTTASPNAPLNFEIKGSMFFNLGQSLLRRATDDPQYLIFICSFISIVPVLFVLYKYSHPFELSLYFFVTTGYFGLSMNGMRQYVAAGILVLGTKYLFSLRRHAFIKYAILVLLAWTIHSSALVMLVVFFVVRRPAWSMSSFLIVIGSVVGLLLFDLILPSFLNTLESTDYSSYSENGWFTSSGEGGSSFWRIIVALIPIIIAYFSRGRIRKLGIISDVLINMAFLNLAIYIISMYNWIFARLAIYCSVYYIIFLAWIVYNGVRPRDRNLYVTLSSLFFIVYERQLSYCYSGYESDYFFPTARSWFGTL